MPYRIENIQTGLRFLKNTRIRTLMTGISYRPTSKNILSRQKTWYFILKSWMQYLLLTDYG